ncbi:Flagella basal body P-ring formation protein FlgA [Paraburkholderia piptadeniae]|uniref:Flagella basal body P-ring formation protein FlgA n=1 Tax=Paraburkholderia piptadeniae TaxID=1701573 RepID=A0A1N7SBB0_9BURK|nr:flagellar basal body P-ring formation chaperone FlgA [Paraburkholderia piptadeniae]SIT44652.1 Flagella basal body P-ring formation protein FlgA [Paraburkholderia piptadeniae]
MPSPFATASRHARRAGARAARALSAMVLVGACAVVSHAHAQENGAPIVIAGPAEKNPAELQAMAERMNAPAPRATAPAVATPGVAAPAVVPPMLGPNPRNDADRFAQAAHADGAIVIPGAAEAVAQRESAVAANAPGMMRVSLQPTSRQVMPVVVAPAQAAARQTAAVQPIAVNPPAGNAFPNAATTQPRGVALRNNAAASAPSVAAPAQVQTQVQTQLQTQLQPQAHAAAQPAAPVPAGQQDGESIRRAALAYLQQQSAGLPGKVEISVATVFPRGLAACTTLEPFLPTGARLWGRTTVGVRCAGERPWTLYIQAKVSVHATYYLASRAIGPGELLTAADLVARDGDLTLLPQAVITDPAQAVGSVALMRVSAGLPLRRDMLKSAESVTIGQSVKVVAQGQGFSISAEGSVMNNASPGQPVKVKMASGQIVQGIVKDGGTVEIQL